MLIKSNFRDYYDNIGGVDTSIVYNRTPKYYVSKNNTAYLMEDKLTSLDPNSDIHLAFNKLKDINDNLTDNSCVRFTSWPGPLWRSLTLNVLVVGNKVFPVIDFYDKYHYTYESFLDLYNKKNPTSKPPRFLKSDWVEFCTTCNRQNFTEVQVLLNSPIFFFEFVYSRFFQLDLFVDCNLSKINTISILDPYQTYQEVSMFISGVLKQPENKTVEITDEKTLLAKHGMGSMSFKQGNPGKKKEQRRKNKARKRNK